MPDSLFTRKDAWSGGYYELTLQLGATDDDRLRQALELLWSHPALDGCYRETAVEPGDQPRLVAGARERELAERLQGIATLPRGGFVPCSTIPVRYVDGDWLSF